MEARCGQFWDKLLVKAVGNKKYTTFRPCLIIDEMTNGERFFRHDLTQAYWMYAKENRQSMAEKDPPVGVLTFFKQGLIEQKNIS